MVVYTSAIHPAAPTSGVGNSTLALDLMLDRQASETSISSFRVSKYFSSSSSSSSPPSSSGSVSSSSSSKRSKQKKTSEATSSSSSTSSSTTSRQRPLLPRPLSSSSHHQSSHRSLASSRSALLSSSSHHSISSTASNSTNKSIRFNFYRNEYYPPMNEEPKPKSKKQSSQQPPSLWYSNAEIAQFRNENKQLAKQYNALFNSNSNHLPYAQCNPSLAASTSTTLLDILTQAHQGFTTASTAQQVQHVVTMLTAQVAEVNANNHNHNLHYPYEDNFMQSSYLFAADTVGLERILAKAFVQDKQYRRQLLRRTLGIPDAKEEDDPNNATTNNLPMYNDKDLTPHEQIRLTCRAITQPSRLMAHFVALQIAAHRDV